MSSYRIMSSTGSEYSVRSRRQDPKSFAPKALTDAAAAQRAAHAKPTDPEARDKGWTGTYRLKPQDDIEVYRYMTQERDAARSLVTSGNTELWMLRFGYTSHKSMEVWLSNPPVTGKVSFNVIATPSWHVGSTRAEKTRNGEKFARENTYAVEVLHRDPSGRTTRLQQFDMKIDNPPEYATRSKDIEIDLNKYKGDIVIRAYPHGSGGVGGYQEARETIVHLP